MAHYLMTGGTGLIGTALIQKLSEGPAKFTLLTRDKSKAEKSVSHRVNLVESLEEIAESETFDYVINLAGEPIADKPWSTRQKLQLWQSRVELTNHLISWLSQREVKPKALISGSAIGWYGDKGDEIVDETTSPHHEYTHSLCDAWEKAALKAKGLGLRVAIMRTGLVLSPTGGILSKLKFPFKLGIGAKLGSGLQYMSWIHIDDMVNGIVFLLASDSRKTNNKLDTQSTKQPEGVFNFTAPTPVTNSEFSDSLAASFNRKCYFRAPARILSLVLGEMSRILITGQRVVPSKLQSLGFEFEYSSLKDALKKVYPK